MTKMEKDIEHTRESMHKLDEKFDKLILHMDEKFDGFNAKFDNLPNLFASKFVERAFWWIISVVGMLLITALFSLIIKGV